MSKDAGKPGTAAVEKKPEGGAPAHQQHSAPKPEGGAPKAGKGHTPLPGGCLSWGCKAKSQRFDFCEEHFEQFKFGLIKKTGEPVPDYEKKHEHYVAFRAKRGAHKVA